MAATTAVEIPAQQGEAPEPTTTEPPAVEIDTEHGSRIVAALEEAWAAIRAVHREVPRVVMITGTGRISGGMKWGHFGADFWTVDAEKGQRAPELFAGGELLAQGGRRTMQTLLHEAAHAVAHARGIEDCKASGGRYHNRKFAEIAREHGLVPPAHPHKILGYSDSHITDETAAKYADAIAALDAAQLPVVEFNLYGTGGGSTGGTEGGEGSDGGDQDDPEQPKKRAGARFPIECQCPTPRRIQITYAAWEDPDAEVEEGEDKPGGGIVCTRCGAEFAIAEVKPRQRRTGGREH